MLLDKKATRYLNRIIYDLKINARVKMAYMVNVEGDYLLQISKTCPNLISNGVFLINLENIKIITKVNTYTLSFDGVEVSLLGENIGGEIVRKVENYYIKKYGILSDLCDSLESTDGR